jgi:hypothetical protein
MSFSKRYKVRPWRSAKMLPNEVWATIRASAVDGVWVDAAGALDVGFGPVGVLVRPSSALRYTRHVRIQPVSGQGRQVVGGEPFQLA